MLIALTGGIASGKSTVADVWSRLGADVIDSDQVARDVVAPGSQGIRQISERFGTEYIRSDGTLDRAALGSKIFADEQARQDLERILHPLIRERSRELFAGSKAKHVVYAIPLLYETKSEYKFDKICTVSAPVDIRLNRLVEHRGLSREEALRRINAQVSDAERESISDVVIDSDCSLEALRGRAVDAWRLLTESENNKHGA